MHRYHLLLNLLYHHHILRLLVLYHHQNIINRGGIALWVVALFPGQVPINKICLTFTGEDENDLIMIMIEVVVIIVILIAISSLLLDELSFILYLSYSATASTIVKALALCPSRYISTTPSTISKSCLIIYLIDL